MAHATLGPRHMTIEQLKQWAETASAYNVGQCAVLIHNLDRPVITIRKVG